MTTAPFPQRAVFLSHAAPDRAAAERLAEALRGGGVEVWLDQAGELEPGDEGNAKIRRQIKDCVLFIAVVSANTEARHEGHFRIEWNLAAERAQGIAQGAPFILPVVIDDTPEAEALVPDRFRKVHWTRLPGGEMPGQVQEHFLNLWRRRITPAAESRSSTAGRPAPASAAPPPSPPTRRYAVAGVIAAVVTIAAAWSCRERMPAQSPGEKKEPAETAAPAPLNSKSLVVLPFENLSADPANVFFTDGLHSEIITALSQIPDLKVISRNSALAFKDATDLPAVARKLNVANVVTGSVQRVQEDVRVTLELRRAADEAVLWSPPPYRRKAEDVFAIQSEIAREVARVLEARQATGTAESARLFTRNPRAWELFQRAKDALYTPNNAPEQRRAGIALLEEALQLDPQFWHAAAYLSVFHSLFHLRPADRATQTEIAAAARRWAEEAIRRAPPGLGGGAMAFYFVNVEQDPVRGLALAEESVRALPGDAERQNLVAYALDTLGRPQEALVAARRALELDPLNSSSRYSELNYLIALRRTAGWDGLLGRFFADFPVMRNRELIESLAFRMHGHVPQNVDAYPPDRRVAWLIKSRRFAEAVQAADALLANAQASPVIRLEGLCGRAQALRHLGRGAEAAVAAHAAVTLAEELAKNETDPRRDDHRLSLAYAVAGRVEDAVAAGKRNLEAVSAKNSLRLRWERQEEFARLCAQVGRARDAMDLLKHLLQVPSGLLIPALKVDPDWDNLREDAGFKALLASPAFTKPF